MESGPKGHRLEKNKIERERKKEKGNKLKNIKCILLQLSIISCTCQVKRNHHIFFGKSFELLN